MSALIDKAKARAAKHPDSCECFDCCLLVGAGEREPGTDILTMIKFALDGFKAKFVVHTVEDPNCDCLHCTVF